MKQTKRLMSIILSLVMLLSITAGIDFSSFANTSGDYEYELLDDGTAEITGYNGKGGNVKIPSKLDGYTVTSIGESAFEYCKTLASITIPNSVKIIEGGAFIRCESLKNITLPDGITSIGGNTFSFCTSLKSITIPTSVTNIDYCAFFGCKSLTSISIPKNVKSIDGQAFNRCENLASINVDNNNKNYTSVNGVLYNKNKTELLKYPEGKDGSFKIPNSVTKIGEFAFWRCENLTSITIPGSVSKIGEFSFNDCTKLKTITIPEKVKQISPCTFSGCKSLTSIKVDKNNKNYTSANGVLYNKKKTQLIRCPEGKSGSFSIPNTVTSIVSFGGCSSLTSVKIPDSVTSIGSFSGCKKLSKITIPKKVKEIGTLAFYDCVKLKDITILSKNVAIGDYAFGYRHDPSTVYDDFSGGLSELPVKGCIIRAYKNSTAEKYAKANGITLNSIVSVTLSSTSYTYNGKVKKPSVTVKDENGKKINKKYYTVSYSKGRKNVGKYTVTIKLKGNYSGTIKKTFTIKPKATSISKVTAGKKAFTVKWKKLTPQTTGYQIQYSTSSKFTAKTTKTVTVSKNKTTSKKISKLTAKKKYYVRVRTYKTVKVNGKNTKIYSGWSKVKTVKTK